MVFPRLAHQDLLSDLFVVNCLLLSLLLCGLFLYDRLVNLNGVLRLSSLFNFHSLVLSLGLFGLHLSLLFSGCLLMGSSENLSTLFVFGISVAISRDFVLLGLLFYALGSDLSLEDSHALTIKQREDFTCGEPVSITLQLTTKDFFSCKSEVSILKRGIVLDLSNFFRLLFFTLLRLSSLDGLLLRSELAQTQQLRSQDLDRRHNISSPALRLLSKSIGLVDDLLSKVGVVLNHDLASLEDHIVDLLLHSVLGL